MRLFIGIPLADGLARELAALVARLRSGQGHALTGAMRWSEPELWHITLQFLGNATQDQFECLAARLGEVRSPVVPVQLGELGCFDRAGVFFADVAASPELGALQKRVVAATSQCGFGEDERPFHPHITLARKTGTKGTSHPSGHKSSAGDAGRKPGNKQRSAGLGVLAAGVRSKPAFPRFVAREFLLYESFTESERARYEIRVRFALDRS